MKSADLKVADIMTATVITVSPDEKIGEVSQLMDKYGIHGIPVVKNKKLTGIITESDFFLKDTSNLHIPSYLNFLEKAEFHKRLSKKDRQKTQELLDATASDIMTKKCITVSPSMSVKQLIKQFKSAGVYTLPVVKAGKVVGVVSRADIVKLIK